MASRLPSDLLSLLERVRLHESGWWNRAQQQLILAAIWMHGPDVDPARVPALVRSNYAPLLSEDDILQVVANLLKNKDLITKPSGFIALSSPKRSELEQGIANAETLEATACRYFDTLLEDIGLPFSPDALWNDFNTYLLTPLVTALGARTYELLTLQKEDPAHQPTLNTFLNRYDTIHHQDLQSLITRFLDPTHPAIRAYLLRLLSGHFLVQSMSLTRADLSAIQNRIGKSISYDIFVDTNFMFSILSAHDNPSNEAADRIVSLIQSLPQSLRCKLYLLPITMEEAKRAIEHAYHNCRELRLPPKIAELGANAGSGGFAKKYLMACANAGQYIDADSYFEPYRDNLLSIARSRSLELYNVDLDELRLRQDVIDDVLSQMEFEERRNPERAKSYDKLMHDMSMWHFVQDKRGIRVTSPLDFKYWIATVDYRFLGFDSFKARRDSRCEVCCLHPSNLLQVLQFWIPRDEAVDEAVIANLRLPFLFYSYDVTDEEATLDILRTLSRYENVGDIPEATVAEILVDKTLRNQIKGTAEHNKKVELVESALAERVSRQHEELEAVRSQLEVLEGAKSQAILELESERRRSAGIEADRHDLSERVERLGNETATLRGMLEANDATRIRDQAVRRFMWQWGVLCTALSLAISLYFAGRLEGLFLASYEMRVVAVLVVCVVIQIASGSVVARNSTVLKADPRFKWYLVVGKLLGAIVVTLALGVAANYVWDLLKAHIPALKEVVGRWQQW